MPKIDLHSMSEEKQTELRNKAFYLLKKYTSYTFLDEARRLYQLFLNAFAKQINNPSIIKIPDEIDTSKTWLVNEKLLPERLLSGWYEGAYQNLLGEMIPIEEGLELLRSESSFRTAAKRKKAYDLILSSKFTDYLFGRGANERSVDIDPFYISLGMRGNGGDGEDVFYVKKVVLTRDYFRAVERVLNKDEIRIYYKNQTGGRNSYLAMSCNYDSIIDEYWELPYHWTEPLPACPPANTETTGQIWSGKRIPVSGIWEPWFMVPAPFRFGCPNYFLAGSKACEYQIEGSEAKVEVMWRLLWEDKRYADGTIPSEEQDYIPKEAPYLKAEFTGDAVDGGEICPKTGYWHTHRLNGITEWVKAGEKMPYERLDKAGNIVVWYLRTEGYKPAQE